MAADSVVLEIAFVRLPAADMAKYESIWAAADEQHLPADVRRQLAENGIRCGLLGATMPTELVEQFAAVTTSLDDRSEDVDTSDTEVNRAPQRRQFRAGRRGKIVVSKTHPSLSVLTRQEGAVRGHLVEDAQCFFALKVYPEGDGRVRLDLTPEIEHGSLKQQWSWQNGAMMQRMGRDRLVLDDLRVVATAAPGQILMISSTPEGKGLGQHYFLETAGGAVERTMLLIRVAQTQHDDLFAPERMTTPLTTPVE
jgi:hypothetical protein